MYAQKKIAWGIDEISIFNNNSEIIFRYSWDDAESNTGNIITFIDKVISFLSGNIDFKEAIQMALINNEGEKVSITYNPQVMKYFMLIDLMIIYISAEIIIQNLFMKICQQKKF